MGRYHTALESKPSDLLQSLFCGWYAADLSGKSDLTDRGHKLWINLSVQHKGQQLAFVIDGTVYRGFVPRQIADNALSVIVDGPFDQATAMALQNNAKYNYFKMRK